MKILLWILGFLLFILGGWVVYLVIKYLFKPKTTAASDIPADEDTGSPILNDGFKVTNGILDLITGGATVTGTVTSPNNNLPVNSQGSTVFQILPNLNVNGTPFQIAAYNGKNYSFVPGLGWTPITLPTGYQA